MPGIFDCHDHVTLSSMTATSACSAVTEWALEAAHQRTGDARGGRHVVRDLLPARTPAYGTRSPAGTSRARAVGLDRPDLPDGGHGDGFFPGPGLEITSGYLMPDFPGKPPYLVDGTEAMRHAVRASSACRRGLDQARDDRAASSRTTTSRSSPEFTLEEIQAAVFEASPQGKAVAAHAYGGEGLDNAVRAASARSSTAASSQRSRRRRWRSAVAGSSRLSSAMRDVLLWAETGRLTPPQCRKILYFGLDLGRAPCRLAREYGVKLAIGTDYIMREQHGKNLEELALMRQAGLTREEALLAATVGGAELCGVDADYGRIAPGYVFDAILLDRIRATCRSSGHRGWSPASSRPGGPKSCTSVR